jgi:two-component system, cell cycle sensor histidine kinase and response regulator CckA
MTEQIQARTEVLSESEEHYRRIVETLHLQSAALNAAANAITITDREGRIEWVNPAFTKLTGYTAEESLGRNPRELVRSGQHDQAFYSNLWETILAGRVWRGELINRHKDGTLYTESETITPVLDEQGQIGHFIAIKEDITERKRLDLHLLRSQRLESVGRLASGIAHDLNNILAPMLMAPSMLRDVIQDPGVRDTLDMIEANAQRGADIIKQLLIFGRGTEGQRVPIQLRLLVKDMATIIAGTFPKNILARQATPGDLWLVSGDPTQLHQILLNLCINARDAMPEGGTLTIELENLELDEASARLVPGARLGRYVRMTVTDTGTGIAPEHLDRIYEPFFTTKEPGKGTGLGLSTVLGIVRSHGGCIQVQSQIGRGTQFQVSLPATVAAEAKPANQANQSLPQGRGELVLVVDDEESVRQVLRQVLERNGYRAIEAANGAEGMTQYVAHQHDVRVVVTDLAMPTMDGTALIRALRRLNPRVRVIAVSGHQSKVKLSNDLGVPEAARLSKPFGGVVLLEALKRVLGSDGAAPRAETKRD